MTAARRCSPRLLVDQLEARPWLVVVTRRGSATGFVPGPDTDALRLRPEPLDPTDGVRLVEEALDDRVEEDLRRGRRSLPGG